MKKIVLIFAAFLVVASAWGQKLPGEKPFATDSVSRARNLARYEEALSAESFDVPGLTCDQRTMIFDGTVCDSSRRALIIYPESCLKNKGGKPVPAPVVFVFHGRRGVISKVIGNMAMYKSWPEAIVVYPQGLWMDGGRMEWGSCWKMAAPRDDGRDIKFFDALYDYVCTSFCVDRSRVYSMGHSNGGGMTFSLWSFRSDKLAAVCISGCATKIKGAYVPNHRGVKPVFFMLAEEDQLCDSKKYHALIDYVVDFQTDGVRRPVQCAGADTVGRNAVSMAYYEAGPGGADVQTCFYHGKHRFNKVALPYIVDFLKAHKLE